MPLKVSSTFSHESVGKYGDPRLRRRVLTLLMQEGSVTRTRLAQALNVSRMTADRISEHLISEGLLTEKHGPDPLNGRVSHLLLLPHDPPLLLVDLHRDAPDMSVYFYDGLRVSFLTTLYHQTCELESNMAQLCEMAAVQWPQSKDAPRCCLLREAESGSAFLPTEHPHISEEEAISHALRHQTALSDKLSLLHLEMHHQLTATLYVREHIHAPWFSPAGGKTFFEIPPHTTAKLERVYDYIASVLSDYASYLSPEAVVVDIPPRLPRPSLSKEHDRCTYLPAAGLPLKALKPETRAAEALLGSTTAQVFINHTPIPLWVSGVVILRRTDRWIKC
ncbi:MAG: hypothetical protein IJW00_02195 [Clostridia bacterium]|nr:hypothetical protein [Clostridia bacterium]